MHLRRRAFLISAVARAAFAVIPSGVTAADPTPPPAPTDEILVRYADDVTARRSAGRCARDARPGGRLHECRRSDRRSSSATACHRRPSDASSKADPRVVAVAPNYQRELTDEITDEDLFANEWGLHNSGQTIDGIRTQTGIADVDIDGLEALRITRGLPDDRRRRHRRRRRLQPSRPRRPEVDEPGRDRPATASTTTGTACVDDVHGWDFCNNNASVYDAGQGGHGTHVAGTIAASLNGTGVVGVAPGIKIMALKFIEDGACGTDEMAIDAIDYAGSFGVPIINASWGGPGASAVLDAAIADAGALFVAAAGNDGLDLNEPGVSFYPAESTVAERRERRRDRPARRPGQFLQLRGHDGRLSAHRARTSSRRIPAAATRGRTARRWRRRTWPGSRRSSRAWPRGRCRTASSSRGSCRAARRSRRWSAGP